MKKFLTVLEYELASYFKNKTYLIMTILITSIITISMFLPNVIDMSGVLGTKPKDETKQETKKETETTNMIIFDKTGSFSDLTLLESAFKDVKWQKAASIDEVKDSVSSEKADAGFVVLSLTEYDYYTYNKNMFDDATYNFNSVLSVLNGMNYSSVHNLEYSEAAAAFSPQIKANETVLGKDMSQNYWYCYALVIIIFTAIIGYGTMIATSVTNEKSNRTIELLITSTNPNSLLFGKVIAGAIASLVQIGSFICMAVLAYSFNKDVWGHKLDMVLSIPLDVLVIFGMFGIGGFLFYAFMYGALGALVSKTEDINKTTGGVQMIVMAVYFIVLIQLQKIDGIPIKIASYLPFSSYSAMFARVAMGHVAIWEIALSFLVLVASIILAGMLGAKIYRMGTLHYGNPIKLTNAFKMLKHDKKSE